MAYFERNGKGLARPQVVKSEFAAQPAHAADAAGAADAPTVKTGIKTKKQETIIYGVHCISAPVKLRLNGARCQQLTHKPRTSPNHPTRNLPKKPGRFVACQR